LLVVPKGVENWSTIGVSVVWRRGWSPVEGALDVDELLVVSINKVVKAIYKNKLLVK
jgi:hypothetical protein